MLCCCLSLAFNLLIECLGWKKIVLTLSAPVSDKSEIAERAVPDQPPPFQGGG